MRRWTVTDAWRLVQAIGASVVLASALIHLSSIPYLDVCETCLAVHPWWWCTFVMLCW